VDRRAAAAAPEAELKHIFVIAGPSGSGKSTFMG
jgi:ABC-type lipoprotein export system ATPase subunit